MSKRARSGEWRGLRRRIRPPRSLSLDIGFECWLLDIHKYCARSIGMKCVNDVLALNTQYLAPSASFRSLSNAQKEGL
jgi:hypothetical protein